MKYTEAQFMEEQERALKKRLNPELYAWLEEHQGEPVEDVVKWFSFAGKLRVHA